MKKKIAILGSKAILGGSETKIYNIARLINKQLVDIDVIFLYEEGPISSKLKDININTYVLDLNKNGYLSTVKTLFKLMKEEKYELVYVFGYKMNFLVRFIYYLGTKVDIYTAVESTRNNKRKIENILDKVTSRSVKKYVCISKDVVNVTINRDKIDSKKVKLIYNGIDCKSFESNLSKKESLSYLNIESLEDQDIIIGTVGNLREAKGHVYLIKALKILKDRGYKNIKCVLVGDGELRENLQNLTKVLDLEEHVTFLGSRNDVNYIIPCFDVFVIPSLWEGFGLAAVEAMVSKVPVIASNVGGLKEVIEDNISGLLSESGNEKDLSDKIELLIKDETLREKIINNGYKRAKLKFDLSDKVNELENLILT